MQESSITFEQDNSLSVKIICNSGEAKRLLVTEGGGLLIDDLLNTRATCTPINLALAWNPRINGALMNAVSLKLEDGILHLTSTDDYSLIFKR